MDVIHDQRSRRFHAVVDGHEAYLYYSFPEEGVLDMQSTFVPPPLRGRAIGAELVEAARRFAEESGFSVRASCWYAARVLGIATEQPGEDGG